MTDLTGATIPDATVSITRSSVTATTDQSGEAVITGLPLGDAQVSITVPGFNIFRSTITIQGIDEQKLDATLQVGTMGGPVTVDIADTPFAQPPQAPKLPALDLPVVQPGAPSYARALQTPDLPSTSTHPPKRRWWQVIR